MFRTRLIKHNLCEMLLDCQITDKNILKIYIGFEEVGGNSNQTMILLWPWVKWYLIFVVIQRILAI